MFASGTNVSTMAPFVVNICGSQDDAHQRYKRQLARVTYVRGKNQTFVTNAASIATSLDRSLQFVAKYLSTELACQGRAGKDIVLTGEFDAVTIENSITNMTSRYVLCRVCGNPETVLDARKDRMRMRCKACGSKSDIPMFDERLAKVVESERAQAKKREELVPDNEVPVKTPDEEVEWKTDASPEAADARRAELSARASELTQTCSVSGDKKI